MHYTEYHIPTKHFILALLVHKFKSLSYALVFLEHEGWMQTHLEFQIVLSISLKREKMESVCAFQMLFCHESQHRGCRRLSVMQQGWAWPSGNDFSSWLRLSDMGNVLKCWCVTVLNILSHWKCLRKQCLKENHSSCLQSLFPFFLNNHWASMSCFPLFSTPSHALLFANKSHFCFTGGNTIGDQCLHWAPLWTCSSFRYGR